MTGEILLSDIELAKRLLSTGRLDPDIISILEHRGIAKEKAIQLLADLKSGHQVAGADYLVIGKALDQVSRQQSADSPASKGGMSERSQGRKTSPEASESRGARPRKVEEKFGQRSSGQGRRGFPVVVVLMLSLLAIGGFFGWRHFQQQKANIAKGAGGKGEQVAAPDGAKKSDDGKTALLRVEIESDGLKLNGVLVNRSDVLDAVRRVYGAASRTNLVENKLCFFYDRQGILLFCPQDGTCDSVLFDYEGKGGAAGSTHPFAGVFQIENETIGPDTDSATLLGIKELGLHQNKPSEKIFKADHGNLELYFAYFGSSAHLSLTEITLKK